MPPARYFVPLLCCFAALQTAGCRDEPDQSDPASHHDSPEELAAAYQKAAAAEDWPELFSLLTEDSQNFMLESLFNSAVREAKRNAATEQSWTRLMERHGLKERTDAGSLTLERKTRLFADLLEWIRDNLLDDAKSKRQFADRLTRIEFSDFEFRSSDSATAKVRLGGEKSPSRFHFTNVDGKWYADLVAANEDAKKTPQSNRRP